ncbi:death-associated inhibitor of apoptosis 1-like [Macrosteles quadrilineatus]|uniref:death-associated inhibitor of apoptosis 1-like n=1 Tax=Macrosteles quadrilineatus TaxID=74068 RepID=UPI0023E26A38|nr:death-associated inhibitor of apoptosis 1-like [Macrosteles quadrilineatus]XP_054290052.1 death-associated inhibitor of apoptosis 1-like [Macrosteles quadrilineatus]
MSDTLRFRYETERLNSFVNWPVSFLNPSSMATSGFYYFQREDVVRCAFCGVEIGSWVEGDDPTLDHKRWSPSCKFVQNMPCGNVPVKNISEDQQPSLQNLGINQIKFPSFPQFKLLESRLKSYQKWPKTPKFTPEMFSEAGFFYTGKEDGIICYYCGGGLNNWSKESDEPWVEHARHFSKCYFLLTTKGKSFVSNVCAKSPTKESKQEGLNEYKLKQEEDNQDILSKKLQKNNPGNNECKICYMEEVAIVFLPCAHAVACVKCALSLTKCAVCRQDINATIRVFFS